MNVDEFDFELPASLIAQDPPKERGGSRLLVVRRTGGIEHTAFANLADHLVPGDLLVVNNTRVFPARLLGHRVPSGGGVECLLLRQLPASNSQSPTPNSQGGAPDPGSRIPDPESWDALVHPGQKLKPGAQVVFERDEVRIRGEVLGMHFQGRRTIRLWTDHLGGLADAIDCVGHIPLPPYIKRGDAEADRDRYQTVYARERGSVAAPTAGLHFTAGQLASLALHGVERVEVTLHVGYGTFKPVKVDRVEDHVIDAERFVVPAETAAALTRANRERRRIIAVGTTSVRALESLTVTANGEVISGSGDTQLFIHPGHQFQLVSGMITNFHLPKSSLLMLVSAFAGRERIIGAYREAVANGYRFYSYGDAMLIL
jgi:S-adenosylmethionine:tRNA ribosyltransferase-isomerase